MTADERAAEKLSLAFSWARLCEAVGALAAAPAADSDDV